MTFPQNSPPNIGAPLAVVLIDPGTGLPYAGAQPFGAPFQQKPLTALISHSFAQRTVTSFTPAVSAQVTNSGTGAVTFTIPNFTTGLTTLSAGNIMRLYGSGTVFDGYWQWVSATSTTISATSPIAVGLPLGTITFAVPLGVAKLFDMGSGGSTGGYNGNWHSILRMTTGDGFQLPPSYCFGYNGGFLVPNASNGDPGLPGWITALLAKSPLPTFCTIDLGVNDIFGAVSFPTTLAAMKSTLIAGAQQLRGAGIIPQVCPVLGAGSTAGGWSLAMSRACKGHNRTILELARQGLILTISPDVMKRLMNPADTNGLGFARNYDSTVNPVVHLSPNGGLEVAHQASASLYGGLLQPTKLLPNNESDAFAANPNPYGSIMPVVSSLLTGVISGTASAVPIVAVTFTASVGGAASGTLTAAIANGTYQFTFSDGEVRTVTVTGGTAASWSGNLSAGTITTASTGQIGSSNINLTALSLANLPSGTGTSFTAAISARVDKWPDGTTVEGSELVISWPAGTYAGAVGAYVSFGTGAGGSLSAGTAYTAGDILQFTAEIEIDSTNLGNSETPRIPAIGIQETDLAGDNNINISVFSDAASPALNTGSGPLLAGVYTLVTPVFQTRTTANAGSNSNFIVPAIILYMSGTVTGGITYRIRGAAVNKIDPTIGEPF